MGLFVSFEEILFFGVSEKYLKKALNYSRDGKSRSWINKKDETDARKVLIDIDSIPERTRKKYNIPNTVEYINQKIDREEAERKERIQRDKERRESKELTGLENAYKHRWHGYYSFYMEFFETRSPETRKELAKRHAQNLAYWLEMVQITGGKWRQHGTLTPAYKYHCELMKELDIIASFESYNRFAVFLDNIRYTLIHKQGIEKSIVHKGINQVKYKSTSDFHKMVLLEILAHPKRYSYPKVTDLVNHVCEQNGYKTVSESWVKAQVSNANPEFRNLVMTTRAGEKHFKSSLQKHAVREQTTLPGDVWMIDGSPIQFWCWSKNRKKYTRLNLFVVVDVSSRKVVGFDISYSEDKYNIMNALQMAVSREKHLPSEIVSDHFSASKSEEIKHIKALFEEMGCRWRHHTVGNPQDKVYVERFYGVFQSVFCAIYDDYLGKGIGSRDPSGNPSPEFLKEAVKKEGYLGEDEMRQRISFLIGLYNQTPRKVIKAPNEAYKLIKPNVSELDFAKTSLIFWKTTKNTVRNSMIKIKIKNKEYTFDIHGTHSKLALNGKTVRVRYDENLLDSIAVFDYHTDEFICECRASVKLVTAAINRTEEDDLNIYKHASENKKFVRDIENMKSEIRDKGLEEAGLQEITLPHPLELSKNQINDQESMSMINYFAMVNNIEPVYKDVSKKGLVTVRHSKSKDYNDSIKTKTSKAKTKEIAPVPINKG
ncbi:MAG: DDE-type integrase/transposase/recombinase [Chryseobacterium sp.]